VSLNLRSPIARDPQTDEPDRRSGPPGNRPQDTPVINDRNCKEMSVEWAPLRLMPRKPPIGALPLSPESDGQASDGFSMRSMIVTRIGPRALSSSKTRVAPATRQDPQRSAALRGADRTSRSRDVLEFVQYHALELLRRPTDARRSGERWPHDACHRSPARRPLSRAIRSTRDGPEAPRPTRQ